MDIQIYSIHVKYRLGLRIVYRLKLFIMKFKFNTYYIIYYSVLPTFKSSHTDTYTSSYCAGEQSNFSLLYLDIHKIFLQ